MVIRVFRALFFAGIAILPSAQAAFIGNSQGGAEFPLGAISFADALVDYSPGIVGSNPALPYRGAANAIGIPDYAGDSSCSSTDDCTFVSLGDGGSIVLSFLNNRLIGSGDSAVDLWIFEVGPSIEDTFVEISKNGVAWNSVGKVFGSSAGIDIDAFGFGPNDLFAFVRLTDDTNQGGQTGPLVGADIDAVGAISSVALPEPASVSLFAAGVVALITRKRLMNRY
jgi:hypothetical protein